MPTIPTMPGSRRWNAMTRQALWLLQTMMDEMQAYYDDRSEAWQEGDQGEAFLERLQAIENAADAAQELCP